MADDRIITALDVHSLDDMKKPLKPLAIVFLFIKSGWNSFTVPVPMQYGI